MARYIIGRVGAMALTLFVILTLAFLTVRLMPGSIYDDPDLPPAVREALEARLHLDKPPLVQYGYFLRGVLLESDWGTSVRLEPGVPAFRVLTHRIPVSLGVNALALALAIPLGLTAGAITALQRGKRSGRAVSLAVSMCIAVPSFVFAALMQIGLGFKLGLFPLVYQPGSAASLVLPVLALTLGPAATITRYVRGELTGLMNSDFMVLARAKGLSRRAAVLRHGLRNAGVTLITVMAPMVAGLLGGSLVVEGIYAIPGVGGIMVDAIHARDHALTVAALIFYSAVSLTTLLLADVAYGLIDPRIRMGGQV